MDKVLNDIKNKPVESITLGFVEDALKLTHSSYIREKIAYNFIKKGWIDLETGKYCKALKSFNRALRIFSSRDDLDGYLLSKHGIASVYTRSHEYGKSLDIYFEILNHLVNKNTDLRFITLKDIAMAYYNWGSYENSIKFLKIAMDIIKNEDSIFRKIYINYYLGKAYLKLDKNLKAQESLFMTLTICDANNVNYKISESLTLLGNIFRKQQNYSRSESFHIRSLQYAKSSMDYRAHIEVLLNLGSMCYYASEYIKGIKFIDSALEEVNQIDDKYMILVKAYHYLHLLYLELEDKEEALRYLQKSMVIKEDEKLRICTVQYDLLHLQFKLSKKPDPFKTEKTKNKELTLELKTNHYKEMLGLGKSIYNNLKNLVHFSFLTIYTLHNTKDTLMQIIIENEDKLETKVIDGKGTPALYVINNNKEVVIYGKDILHREQNFNKSKLTKGMESFIVIPILRAGTVVGAISIEDKEKNKYTQFDLNTLKTLSAYISLSIENLRIKSEVESLNTLMEHDTIIIESDELNKGTLQRDRESGLPLKPLYIELLNQSIKGTKRQKGKLAVFTIIIDLIFEKKDIFLSEDLVITEHTISNRIKKSLRSEDILGRGADDTYMLTTKMDSIRGCRAVAQKLTTLINEPLFTENQKIQPKVKIGISIYPDNYLTAVELLERSKKCAEKIPKDSSTGYEFSDSLHNITGID